MTKILVLVECLVECLVEWAAWVAWAEWACKPQTLKQNLKRAVFTALFFIYTKIISDEGFQILKFFLVMELYWV
jgi:hypothetical protein